MLQTTAQINAVIGLVRAAMKTGDDVSLEIEGGLNLIQGAISTLENKIECAAWKTDQK